MRYDAEELARENAELHARAERDARLEQREFEQEQERRRTEAEDAYTAMRLTGRDRSGNRVAERSLSEIFQRASDAADEVDQIEETRRVIAEDRGGYLEPNYNLEHDRARHQREWFARAAKDPVLLKQLERELERRNRDLERYLYQQDLPSNRSNTAGQYFRGGGPITEVY